MQDIRQDEFAEHFSKLTDILYSISEKSKYDSLYRSIEKPLEDIADVILCHFDNRGIYNSEAIKIKKYGIKLERDLKRDYCDVQTRINKKTGIKYKRKFNQYSMCDFRCNDENGNEYYTFENEETSHIDIYFDDNKHLYKKYCKVLTDVELKVLELRLMNISMKEISKILSLTYKQVRVKMHNIKNKIKAEVIDFA